MMNALVALGYVCLSQPIQFLRSGVNVFDLDIDPKKAGESVHSSK